jgi:hypothetical protein
MANDEIESVDDLRYEWPDNVLGYETKLWGGLTLQEMLAVIGPFMLCVFVVKSLAGILLGAVCGLGVLMSVKKLDALGNRSIVAYLFARVAYNAKRAVIDLPLIMPVGNDALVVESWAGETLMTVGEASNDNSRT